MLSVDSNRIPRCSFPFLGHRVYRNLARRQQPMKGALSILASLKTVDQRHGTRTSKFGNVFRALPVFDIR